MSDVLNVFLGVLSFLSFAGIAYLGAAFFDYADKGWKAIVGLAGMVFGVSGFITVVYAAIHNLKPF